MNQNRNNNIKYAVVMILIIIIIGVLTLVNFQFSKQNPGGNDFLARWNGAHEWLINGNNPYTNQVSEVAQKMIYGRTRQSIKRGGCCPFCLPHLFHAFLCTICTNGLHTCQGSMDDGFRIGDGGADIYQPSIIGMEDKTNQSRRDLDLFHSLVLFSQDDHSGSIFRDKCIINSDQSIVYKN